MQNFSKISSNNQFVFLGTGRVYGINSLQVKNNLGAEAINYVGVGTRDLNQSVNSSQYSDLSLNASFIQEDLFIQQTGTQPINCFIFRDLTDSSSVYSLTSGYLNSYSARYAPNQVPEINSTFRFYREAGNLPLNRLSSHASGQISGIMSNQYNFNSNVGDSNYISLGLNEYNTTRVQDFSFSIDFNHIPIYNIGSRFPKRIETIYPINVSCNVTFEAPDNFSDIASTDFPFNKTQQNINLGVYSNRTNKLMGSYSFSNMTLVDNQSSINSNNNLIISRQYVGQLFGFVNASGIVGPSGLDFGFVIASPSFSMEFGFVSQPFTSSIDWGGI